MKKFLFKIVMESVEELRSYCNKRYLKLVKEFYV